MKLNWVSYYMHADGYGRFSSRMVAALIKAGVDVTPLVADQRTMPPWMWERLGISWDHLTVSCVPPWLAEPVPSANHWLFTMCEGSRLPKSWVTKIRKAGVQKILVPCRHNQEVFINSGVKVPVEIVPLGIDPAEFPILQPRLARPYTFLALADRGGRKGYEEAFDAFYKAFGGKTTGVQDVRLIIKHRKGSNRIMRFVAKAAELDPRLCFIGEDVDSMADVYALTDCFVIPSYCEGWGMPHREAAAMGVRVITQRYSGMDDGHTDKWAMVVEGGQFIQDTHGGQHGWLKPDVGNLAKLMVECYQWPATAAKEGLKAAQWLRDNQTWEIAAQKLLDKLEGLNTNGIRSQVVSETQRPVEKADQRVHPHIHADRAQNWL